MFTLLSHILNGSTLNYLNISILIQIIIFKTLVPAVRSSPTITSKMIRRCYALENPFLTVTSCFLVACHQYFIGYFIVDQLMSNDHCIFAVQVGLFLTYFFSFPFPFQVCCFYIIFKCVCKQSSTDKRCVIQVFIVTLVEYLVLAPLFSTYQSIYQSPMTLLLYQMNLLFQLYNYLSSPSSFLLSAF